MKKIVAAVLVAGLTLGVSGTAFAGPTAHVHNPNHCQNLANGMDVEGLHTAHNASDRIIGGHCGH